MIKKISFLFFFIIFATAAMLCASDTFRALCADLVKKNSAVSVVKGIDGWLFLKDELSHLAAGKFWAEGAESASRTSNKKFADPLPAIVEYNKLLADKGISLYLVPVPPKGLIYPEKLAENVAAGSSAEDIKLYETFYSELAESGVKTIDLIPALLEAKADKTLYCLTDTHFSGSGLELFASKVAEELKKQSWYSDVKKNVFTKKNQTVNINGDLKQMAGTDGQGEQLELSVVTNSDGTLLESDPQSPVVLLGDSHALVFNAGGDLHAKGAGLFDHLSAELGFPVDLLGVRGSGVTPARIKFYQRSKKDASYLENKKVVIWCFTARDFTGTGGWKMIPVAP